MHSSALHILKTRQTFMISNSVLAIKLTSFIITSSANGVCYIYTK